MLEAVKRNIAQLSTFFSAGRPARLLLPFLVVAIGALLTYSCLGNPVSSMIQSSTGSSAVMAFSA